VALRIVFDTNVALYQVNGNLAGPLPAAEYFVSVISRIEMLSFPGLTADEEAGIRLFLSDTTVVGLDDQVEAETVRLRRSTRLKMADAIIVATAIVLGADLYTHDANLLKVPGLTASAPLLRRP